ncbi:MAG: hypothetical protein R2695_18170 [Acidimicrobiales bacterium]
MGEAQPQRRRPPGDRRRRRRAAGAEAVVLTNTLLGMAIDTETRRPVLGAGAAVCPARASSVAVRAVFDVHEADPDLPIVGVGGTTAGVDVVEFLLAGASAVEVGTATFADRGLPRGFSANSTNGATGTECTRSPN